VEDPLYLEERYAREITFRKHLRRFEKFTGPPAGRSLLDVGAYLGVFVEEAIASGWDAQGVEPSLWAVNYATQRGLNVQRGTLEEVNLPSEGLDAVTMWDVIEHLGDPLAELRHMHRVLKPGGWIAVHTMDIDSLFARLMGPRWPWLMEMHIYYFSRRTLADMIAQAGFQVKAVRPEGRFLRLRYLTTRLRAYNKPIADLIDSAASAMHLDTIALPINFGDLVTAYAQKR
jgi:ubiquinone/menaquinone biosynthesis C-methylase UbiE